MSSRPTTVGYTLGRFNPLQKGHEALLEQVNAENDYMVVLVGSATESRTHKNPLSFEERKALILSLFPRARVLPMPDMPNDADWVKMFETTIAMGIDILRLKGDVSVRMYSADATRGDDYALRCSWVQDLGHTVVPFTPVMARTDLSASLVRDSWYSGRYDDVKELVPENTLALLQRLDLTWTPAPYIKQLAAGTMAARNNAFVVFVTEPEHLYRVDPACRARGDTVWNAKLALLGYVVRWNGALGFVGGAVDEGETLVEAVVRECGEEVGYVIDPLRLVLFCSHTVVGKDSANHLFVCKVSAEELYAIRRLSVDAPHARTEMSAFAVTHMTPEAPDVLIAQKWAGTAKEELRVLLTSGTIPPAQSVT